MSSPVSSLWGASITLLTAANALKRKNSHIIPEEGADVPIYLMDESVIILKIFPNTTVEAAAAAINLKMGLLHDRHFSIMEYIDGQFLFIQDSYSLAKIVQRWKQLTFFSGPRKLYYRRSMTNPGSVLSQLETKITDPDDPLLYLQFSESVHHFLSSRYRFSTLDTVKLVALLLHCWSDRYMLPPDDPIESIVSWLPEICPAHVLLDVESDQKVSHHLGKAPCAITSIDMAQRVYERLSKKSLNQASHFEAQNAFMILIRSLPLYGAEFFKGVLDNAPILVAVSFKSLFLLSQSSPLDVVVFDLADISTWSLTRDLKTFIFSTEDGTTFSVNSDYAKFIEIELELYLAERMNTDKLLSLALQRQGNPNGAPLISSNDLLELDSSYHCRSTTGRLDLPEFQTMVDAPKMIFERELDEQKRWNFPEKYRDQLEGRISNIPIDSPLKNHVASELESKDNGSVVPGSSEEKANVTLNVRGDPIKSAVLESAVESVRTVESDSPTVRKDEPSVSSASSSASKVLPFGWSQFKLPDGRLVYVNLQTQESQYEYPTETAHAPNVVVDLRESSEKSNSVPQFPVVDAAVGSASDRGGGMTAARLNELFSPRKEDSAAISRSASIVSTNGDVKVMNAKVIESTVSESDVLGNKDIDSSVHHSPAVELKGTESSSRAGSVSARSRTTSVADSVNHLDISSTSELLPSSPRALQVINEQEPLTVEPVQRKRGPPPRKSAPSSANARAPPPSALPVSSSESRSPAPIRKAPPPLSRRTAARVVSESEDFHEYSLEPPLKEIPGEPITPSRALESFGEAVTPSNRSVVESVASSGHICPSCRKASADVSVEEAGTKPFNIVTISEPVVSPLLPWISSSSIPSHSEEIEKIEKSNVNPVTVTERVAESEVAAPKRVMSGGIPIENVKLPKGWAAALDLNSNELYYFNLETGRTQWTRPFYPHENLQPGWRVLLDGDGDPYYWEVATNEVSYLKPCVVPEDSVE